MSRKFYVGAIPHNNVVSSHGCKGIFQTTLGTNFVRVLHIEISKTIVSVLRVVIVFIFNFSANYRTYTVLYK